jgi:DNA-binding NarL/FixJ family response regulator
MIASTRRTATRPLSTAFSQSSAERGVLPWTMMTSRSLAPRDSVTRGGTAHAPRATGQPRVAVALGRFGELIRRLLTDVMAEDRAIDVIARDLDVPTLLRAVARQAPQVVVLDVENVGEPSELGNLRAAVPETGIVLLTRHPCLARSITFLAAGVVCISLDDSEDELLLAVHLAADGLGRVAIDNGRVVGSPPSRASSLTPRETQVLEQISKGLTGVQIAHELHIDPETVKTHSEHIYRKLNVRGRRDLVGFRIARSAEI